MLNTLSLVAVVAAATAQVAVVVVLEAFGLEPLLLRQQLIRWLLVLAAPQALTRPQPVQVLRHLYLALSLLVVVEVLQVILILLERAVRVVVAREIISLLVLREIRPPLRRRKVTLAEQELKQLGAVRQAVVVLVVMVEMVAVMAIKQEKSAVMAVREKNGRQARGITTLVVAVE